MVEMDGEFRQALFGAVDEGLLMLGESGRKSVYFHLQNLCSLEQEDILEKPAIFVQNLRKIFGIGAEVIEKAIIKSLYSKLGLSCEEKRNFSFLEFVNEAKHSIRHEHKEAVIEISDSSK